MSRQSSGSPTILPSRPHEPHQPSREAILATMRRHNIGYQAAMATCRYAHALWVDRRRNWVTRDCDAGGQILIERKWETSQFRQAYLEKQAIKAFAKEAERIRRDVGGEGARG